MCTLEAAFELRGASRYMVASQSEVPIEGTWPWEHMIRPLIDGAAPAAVGPALVRSLGDFLDLSANREPFNNAPISLVDTDLTELVAGPLQALTDELCEARKVARRRQACMNAIEGARVGRNTPDDPGDPALLDVLTLCDRLESLTPDPVAGLAIALRETIQGRLVLLHRAQLADRHRGISLYCRPIHEEQLKKSNLQGSGAIWEADKAYYRTLRLCARTGWDRIALEPLTDRE
jgi:hypothetical protein